MTLSSVEQLVGIGGGGANLPATTAPPRAELPGLRKSAVFLAQMTMEEAGILLAKLRPREVESLTRELMRLNTVEPDDVDGVLNEFHQMMTAQRFVGRGGVDFAREILAAGLGEDKADGILSRLNVVYTEVPFASLRNADVRQLVTFLKDEHPQVIALVLAHLTAAQPAEVLSMFNPEQQAEVAAAKKAEQQAQMWSLVKTGGIALGILLVILIVWLRSRRRGELEEEYEPLELSDDMLAELERLRVSSTRDEPVVDTAALELEAAERQRVRSEISTMVAEKPDEVAAMLRGWLSESKSGASA